MKIYKVNNKRVIRELFGDVILYTAILIVWIFFLYYYISCDIEFFSILSLATLIVYLVTILIPVLYLYENYRFNKDTTLILEKEKIIYNKEVIKLSEIRNINIIATHQYFNGKVSEVACLAYNPYFYYIEIVMDKKKYYLTSLLGFSLGEDMRKCYPNLEYREVVRGYPLVKK